MGNVTTPSAEAIERLLEAAQYWIDGPGEAARLAAIAMQDPGFDLQQAAAHWSTLGLTTAKAWGITVAAWSDVIAILAEEPRGYELHEVELVGVLFPAFVTVSTGPISWIELFVGDTPIPLPTVQPSPTVPPGSPVRVEANPLQLIVVPAQPATVCDVDLLVQPVSGSVSQMKVRLDASTLRTT